jgi:AcrR family transcriptional regulator
MQDLDHVPMEAKMTKSSPTTATPVDADAVTGRRTGTTPQAARGKYAPVQLDEREILRRGLDTFAELGYDGTTMRELARRLGVSHNFINDRYGSKERFWRAVVDLTLLDARSVFDQSLEEVQGDDERLRAVIVQLYRLAANASQMNRLIADESTRDSSRLNYLHQQFVKPFWDRIEPIINRLIAAGRIPPVPTQILYFAVTGPALALAQAPMADRLSASASSMAAQNRDGLADQLSHLVLRGLLPPVPTENSA